MITVSSNFFLPNAMNIKGKQSHFYFSQHVKYNKEVKLDMGPKGQVKFYIGKYVGEGIPKRGCIVVQRLKSLLHIWIIP